MDRSLPGSSIHGIFQARVLEWDAIIVWEVPSKTDVRPQWEWTGFRSLVIVKFWLDCSFL